MNDQPGTSGSALRVAIIGSGPAGFYAAEHLLRQEELPVKIDLFDRLPTPFGLVRAGVAPDHPKIKSVIRVYEKTAARDGFRFFGNVVRRALLRCADAAWRLNLAWLAARRPRRRRRKQGEHYHRGDARSDVRQVHVLQARPRVAAPGSRGARGG